MKVLFISNIPSPYNIEFLEELGKLSDVTAVFERATSSERDKSWRSFRTEHIRCIILKGIKIGVDKAFAPAVIKFIKQHKENRIIIANPLTPTGIFSIFYCKSKNIPYAIQSEGGISGSGRGFKEWCKKRILTGAALYLSGMSLKNEYFLTYGASPEKVKQYPFTSLYKKDILSTAPLASVKEQTRNKLGMREAHIIISVGRIIYGKGYDVLLKSCSSLDNQAVGIYIVGGKPDEKLLQIVNQRKMDNVHFIDYADKQTLQQYYISSDLFVLATRGDTWGLVINEAMANGLPVITTDKCVAGVELVEDGVNGYIVESENVAQLKERIESVIYDAEKCSAMGSKSLERIAKYSYEEMAGVVYEAICRL